jgi:hypothetical protein
MTLEMGNVLLSAEEDLAGSMQCGVVVDGSLAIAARVDPDHHLRLDLNLCDVDNHPLIRIIDGELQVAAKAWDVEIVGRRIEVRGALGDIQLALSLHPPDRLVVDTASLFVNHVPIRAGRAVPGGGLFLNRSLFDTVALVGGTISYGAVRPPYTAGYRLPDNEQPRWYGAPPAPPGGSFSPFSP